MDERTLTPQIRIYFWGAGTGFAGIAGLLLFLLPEKTDRLFAWTIARGDTAAFLGACFLAVSLVSALCFGVRVWAGSRVCFLGTLAFVTAMSLATLLHLDQFHFGSDEFIAQAMAWGWTAVYLVAPVAGAVMLSRQRATPGTDPDPVTPIVPGLRYLLLAQGAALLGLGLALIVVPSAEALWPWPLTELAARAIGSFLLGLGIMLVGAGHEDAAERLEPPCTACWWLAVLVGMAVFRFDGGVEVGSVTGLLFTLMVVSLLISGVAGEMAARRARSTLSG